MPRRMALPLVLLAFVLLAGSSLLASDNPPLQASEPAAQPLCRDQAAPDLAALAPPADTAERAPAGPEVGTPEPIFLIPCPAVSPWCCSVAIGPTGCPYCTCTSRPCC